MYIFNLMFIQGPCMDTIRIILVPRAHDPSGLCEGSRALAGPDFLSMRRAFVSYSRPIRFDGKSVNRRLPVLDQARALDPCQRPEGSWALGTRMHLHAFELNGLPYLNKLVLYFSLPTKAFFCYRQSNVWRLLLA